MKKFSVLILTVLLFLSFSACSSSLPEERTTSSNSDKSEILSQQKIDDFRYSEAQQSSNDSVFITDMESPKSFTKIIKNEKMYVYDSNGNSLIASNEKKYNNFSSLTKKDYAKILGSNFSGVKLLDFKKTSIKDKNAIRIEFESTKNEEKFLNICYYLDCENNGIKILIQAKTDKTLKELEKTIDTIELD